MNIQKAFNATAQAALECAAHGWHVFPVPPGTKKSHKSAEHSGGRKWGATTNTDEIRADWTQWPQANVGIVTGPESGFFVIDADTMDGHGIDGLGTFREWIKENGDLLHTLEVLTPSGGLHVYFRYPANMTIQTNSGKLAPGIDVRGAGGMVLAPPSVKPDGTAYKWNNPPGFFDLADAPQWLLDRIEQAQRPNLSERAAVAVLPHMPTGLDEIADLLDVIDPDAGSYDQWCSVLMALHDHTGGSGDGLALAEHWSQRGSKYKPGEVEKKWKSFQPGGGVSKGTIAALARASGADLSAIATKHKGATHIFAASPRAATSDGQPRPNDPNPGSTFRHNEIALVRDDKDRPIWNVANAIAILTEHPDWLGVLGFNEFTMRKEFLSAAPGGNGGTYPREIHDDDYTAAQAWFNQNGFPRAGVDLVISGVRNVCRNNAYDPLKDFLNGLHWDGQARLAAWLTTYCGVEDSAYASEVGKRWMISAVARGLNPGCKADHMLVLEGTQGKLKSTALRTLAGESWFSDGLPQMGSKDASAHLRGKWILEVAELAAMKREQDQIKAFVSRQVECFREAYGREEVTEPRRCVFAGTTNKDDWHNDSTGGRRFWPVKVGKIDVAGIARDREQLWAEAVAAYKAGERWWLKGDVEEAARQAVAERAAGDDPWHADVMQFCVGRAEVAIAPILESLGLDRDRRSRKDSDRVAEILRQEGWTRDGKFSSGPLKACARYVPGA